MGVVAFSLFASCSLMMVVDVKFQNTCHNHFQSKNPCTPCIILDPVRVCVCVCGSGMAGVLEVCACVCLCKYIYLSRLKFIFDAMLKAFPLDFHRGQHQAISYEMGRVSDAFGCFETIRGN